MSRTRAPRKTGFFAAGRSWPNLNSRKKIKFFRGQEGPENSVQIRVWNRGWELCTWEKQHVQIYRNQIARASARGAQVTLLVKFVPKFFFSENGQKWCFEWWEGLVKGLWGWESCFWCNLGAILSPFGEVPFGQFRCSWAAKPIMLQFVKCLGNVLVF